MAIDATRSSPQTSRMFSFGLIGDVKTYDPLILLLGAMGLDALFGGFRNLFRLVPHPEAWLRRVVTGFERKLNREKRSPMDRAVRGLVVSVVVVAATIATGIGVAWLSRNHDFGWIIELVLIAALIDQRGRYVQVRLVGAALAGGNLEAARTAVAPLVQRDPTRMDDYGIARTAIEAGAEGYCSGVVAPVFWYALFGFPGLAVCRALSVMDAAIGHSTPRYRAFGMVAARLDDITQLVPARLAGMFLALAALFAPTAKPGQALRLMVRDAGKHRSMNMGWPVAAVAGALNLALCGARHYAERTVNDPWIGTGTARAEANHIRRSLYLFAVACLINVMWVAALATIRFSGG